MQLNNYVLSIKIKKFVTDPDDLQISHYGKAYIYKIPQTPARIFSCG